VRIKRYHLVCLLNGWLGWRRSQRLWLRRGWFGYVIDSLIVSLKQLIDLPVREHTFEYATVVGIGKSD
jgi:hypothetical protein